MSTLSVTTITGANTIKSGTASTPPTIQDSNGTQVGTFCRAWVNFNGTGTVAIRASFNVTSITDNNTGDYTVNFTNALADANYAVVMSTRDTGTATAYTSAISNLTAPTTTAVRVKSTISTPSAADTDVMCVAVFR